MLIVDVDVDCLLMKKKRKMGEKQHATINDGLAFLSGAGHVMDGVNGGEGVENGQGSRVTG